MEVMARLDSMFDCLNSVGTIRNELSDNMRDLVTTDKGIYPFVLLVSGCGQ